MASTVTLPLWPWGRHISGHQFPISRIRKYLNPAHGIVATIKCSGTLSCVQLFGTPWTMARQAPLSMKCSRQGYWPGVPFPSPGSLPDPGVKAGPAALQPDSLPAFSPKPTPSPTPYHKGSCISLWMLYLLLHLSLALECAYSKTIRT